MGLFSFLGNIVRGIFNAIVSVVDAIISFAEAVITTIVDVLLPFLRPFVEAIFDFLRELGPAIAILLIIIAIFIWQPQFLGVVLEWLSSFPLLQEFLLNAYVFAYEVTQLFTGWWSVASTVGSWLWTNGGSAVYSVAASVGSAVLGGAVSLLEALASNPLIGAALLGAASGIPISLIIAGVAAWFLLSGDSSTTRIKFEGGTP